MCWKWLLKLVAVRSLVFQELLPNTQNHMLSFLLKRMSGRPKNFSREHEQNRKTNSSGAVCMIKLESVYTKSRAQTQGELTRDSAAGEQMQAERVHRRRQPVCPLALRLQGWSSLSPTSGTIKCPWFKSGHVIIKPMSQQLIKIIAHILNNGLAN